MSMNRSPKLRPTPWDALVVLAVLALTIAVGWRFWRAPADSAPTLAVVSVDGEEIERLPLSDAERTYTSRGYTLHAVFSSDGVRVTEADCPTQDCVRTGEIRRAGESIVCLPARIVITLTGSPPDYDVIAG